MAVSAISCCLMLRWRRVIVDVWPVVIIIVGPMAVTAISCHRMVRWRRAKIAHPVMVVCCRLFVHGRIGPPMADWSDCFVVYTINICCCMHDDGLQDSTAMMLHASNDAGMPAITMRRREWIDERGRHVDIPISSNVTYKSVCSIDKKWRTFHFFCVSKILKRTRFELGFVLHIHCRRRT